MVQWKERRNEAGEMRAAKRRRKDLIGTGRSMRSILKWITNTQKNLRKEGKLYCSRNGGPYCTQNNTDSARSTAYWASRRSSHSAPSVTSHQYFVNINRSLTATLLTPPAIKKPTSASFRSTPSAVEASMLWKLSVRTKEDCSNYCSGVRNISQQIAVFHGLERGVPPRKSTNGGWQLTF